MRTGRHGSTLVSLLALCVAPCAVLADGSCGAWAGVNAPSGEYLVGDFIEVHASAGGSAESSCTGSGGAEGNCRASYIDDLMGFDSWQRSGGALLTGEASGSVMLEVMLGQYHMTEPEDVGRHECNAMARAQFGYEFDGNIEFHHDCDGYEDCPDHLVATAYAYSVVEPEEPPGPPGMGFMFGETPDDLLSSVIQPNEVCE